MRLTLPQVYSQWDGRWNTNFLGFNTANPYNIHNYGCLITCLAMVSKYYGYDDTPATINKDLKDANGFVGGGLYVWGKYPAIRKNVKETSVTTPEPLTDTQYNTIKEALSKGYPVMLQIDYNPSTAPTDMHYVLCIGFDEGDENNLTIADPLGGVVRSLKDYLKGFRPSMRKSIEQFVIYEGKVPAQTGTLPPDFPDLVNKATKWDGTVKEVMDIKDRNPKDVSLDELKQFVGRIRDERDSANRRLSNIKNEQVDGNTVGYYITELGNRSQQVERLKVEKTDVQTAFDNFKAEVAKGNKDIEALRKADKELIEKLQTQVADQGKALGTLEHEKGQLSYDLDQEKLKTEELATALEEAKKSSVASLTVYDVLELLFNKIAQALRNTKLKG